jgi:hypothetical protein
MPNSQNRSNNNSNAGKGQPKDRPSNDQSSEKPNPERSDIKHDTDKPKGQHGDTSRSSNQGRKEASGGSAND